MVIRHFELSCILFPWKFIFTIYAETVPTDGKAFAATIFAGGRSAMNSF